MKNSISTLDLVERQFNEVASFLATGDAVSLAASSQALKDLVLELVRCLPQIRAAGTSKADRLRLKMLAAGVQTLRENLSRRAAFVDCAVRVLVPTPPKATYSVGGTRYASAIQQTGAFKVLAA